MGLILIQDAKRPKEVIPHNWLDFVDSVDSPKYYPEM